MLQRAAAKLWSERVNKAQREWLLLYFPPSALASRRAKRLCLYYVLPPWIPLLRPQNVNGVGRVNEHAVPLLMA